jgi:pseudo-rSAM protein
MNEEFFYLEPYTYISNSSCAVLMYNSLSNRIITDDNPEIVKFVSDLIENNNVLKIDPTNNNIKEFIQSARENFLGDVYSIEDQKEKPFIMSSNAVLMRDVKAKSSGDSLDFSIDSLKYLSELTIYLNENCTSNCDDCSILFKQTTSCIQSNSKDQLEYSILETILDQVSLLTNFKSLNIVGGDIFNYYRINELLNKIKNVKVPITFHFKDSQLDFNNLKKLDFKNVIISLVFYKAIGLEKLKSIKAENFCSLELNLKFLFTSGEEFDKYRKYQEKYSNISVRYIPIFNKKNIKFFEENIFLTKDSIIKNVIDIKTIHINQKINSLFFGKLFLKSNGDAYDNLNNDKSIGSIYELSLADLVYKTIKYGSYWDMTRNKIRPCQDCIYKDLCPPISNYELVLKRMDLCKLNNQMNN